MFHRARLKLTAWYILLAFIITCLFSLLSYNGLRFELEQGLQRQRVFFQQGFMVPNGPPITILRRTDPELMQDLRMHLIFRILYIDGAIILIAAIGGYLLAGRSLKPIQKMVDEQNRFITDASHELRTPLTSLRSELEASLLSKKMSEKEARDVLRSNLEEVISLQNLSDNLLELATKEKPLQQHSLGTVDILEVIEESIKKIIPLAKKKHIIIDNKVKSTEINGERGYLTELFVILLDNAIKYSNSHTTVKLTSSNKDKAVIIAVKDEGIGISKEDQEKIFERFYRSDRSRTKSKTKGYGLGLAIAQQIVTDHRGTIHVKSELDKGTTFTVSLPSK
jgi:signal transduction histidine kinase